MALAVKHNVDVFVPVSAPVSSVYDAKFGEAFAEMRRERRGDVVTPALCLSEKLCRIFDDNHTFSEFCETNGPPWHAAPHLRFEISRTLWFVALWRLRPISAA